VKRPFAAICAMLIGIALPTSLPAKGRTLKIVISTADQAASIEVTDDAVSKFNVWSGAGVEINNVPQTKGFIVEWTKDPVPERPNNLRRYRVSFFTGCHRSDTPCSAAEAKLSYLVLYEYDPAAKEGYVYLPGKGDDGYKLNTRSIFRRVEGDWFHATQEWQEFIAPFIATDRVH
jgi:hypothetical protein